MTPFDDDLTRRYQVADAIEVWETDPADPARVWVVEELVPGLDEAELEIVITDMAGEGLDPDEVRVQLAAYLPRLANGYLDPRAVHSIDVELAERGLDVECEPWIDPLPTLVRSCADLAHAVNAEAGDVLAYVREREEDDCVRDVVLRRLDGDATLDAWEVGADLEADPEDGGGSDAGQWVVRRFALLTRRFGDLHLLLGCPRTGRRDALVCRRRPYIQGDDGARTGWRDEALPAARALIGTIMAGLDGTAPLPRVYLNHMPELGWLTALEFGRVDDAQGPDAWHGITEDIGLRVEDGRVVGFALKDIEAYDPDEHPELWRGPRFCAPQLGLERASVNEVFVAATALYGEQPSVNRLMFGAAIRGEGEDALQTWLQCLQAGDGMAHYALGYTLLELGRNHEAYRHLRYYTEISPGAAWNWWYRAKAAAALGLVEEARDSYTRAIELDEDDETGAADDLAVLGE